MSLDKKVFKDKSLSDLFGEIYDNSKKTRGQVGGLIDQLKVLMTSITDANILVPLIKEYLEIGVKNDEHLIKLATIIQRLETSTSTGAGDSGIDFEEIQDLLEAQQRDQATLESKKKDDK